MDNTNLEELAAALNGHQVTDEDGALTAGESDTPAGDTAAPEMKTTDEESARAEKSADTEETAPQAADEVNETELAEDESGKRYVPKSRFDKVYGKAKQLERDLEAERLRKAAQAPASTPAPLPAPFEQPTDKTEVLEVELLKSKLPQFDPDSDQYDRELDALGAEVYRANPGITRIEAARRAASYAKSLTKKIAEARAEARTVKAVQSDQGITSRVSSRGETTVDPDRMTLEQKEEWLRANGEW